MRTGAASELGGGGASTRDGTRSCMPHASPDLRQPHDLASRARSAGSTYADDRASAILYHAIRRRCASPGRAPSRRRAPPTSATSTSCSRSDALLALSANRDPQFIDSREAARPCRAREPPRAASVESQRHEHSDGHAVQRAPGAAHVVFERRHWAGLRYAPTPRRAARRGVRFAGAHGTNTGPWPPANAKSSR